MNPSDMLDHALGMLDENELELLDAQIAADPALSVRLDLLRARIDFYLDDKGSESEEFEPPANLAERAIECVASSRRRWTVRDFAPVRVPFRWADVAVAAAILFAGLLTLLPPVHRSRVRMDQAACGLNLQQLGVSLAQYSATNRSFPYPDPKGPVPYAGMTAMLLKESGHLTDSSVLDCPSNGKHSHASRLPDLDSFLVQEIEQPFSGRKMLCGDYAFSLGFDHMPGKPGPIPALSASIVPLMADMPPHRDDTHEILAGNSPNHHGRGQNVLFTDGHVDWLPSRRVPSTHDADLFSNENRNTAPGLHVRDAVLVPGCFRIDGR